MSASGPCSALGQTKWIYFFNIFIGVKLLYNGVLVSAV